MIATILPGSSNFHAVGYNERKVSKGVARLIEILNFGSIGTFGKPTPDELIKYLQEYSSSNERILKAQFHLAISCKGKEMSENELLDFATPQERFDRIEAFIDDLFTLNPKITQGEIYDKLWRKHAYIKKGVIYFNGQTRPLKQFLADAIARNGRVKWIEGFGPMTEAERDLLCKVCKVTDPSFVSLSSGRDSHYRQALNLMGNIFADTEIADVRGKLREEGFIIKQDGDNTFAINFSKRIIINLTEEGFDLSRLRRQYPEKQHSTKQQQQKKSPLSGIRKLKDAGGGSQSEKREWEVGYKGDYDRIDDGQSLKM